MKSERRHELATNELADWITHLPRWFAENRSSVIIGAVVVVALIAYTIFYYSREDSVASGQQVQISGMLDKIKFQKDAVLQGRSKGLDVSNGFFNLAGSLDSASRTAENPNLAALAMIKRAEALRGELQYRDRPAEADVVRSQINQAMGIYTSAVETAKTATIIGMARYGQGCCLEDMDKFDQAAAIYTELATDEKYNGTIYKSRAADRLAILPEIRNKVVFVKVEPKQSPAEAPAGSALPEASGAVESIQ